MGKYEVFYIVAMVIKTVYCQENHETDSSEFPDMFYMDNYYECIKQKDNSYCTANMHLIPRDVNSDLWKKIEAWSIPRYHFNRSIIHKTFCVPSKYKDYLDKKSFFEIKTNQELKRYNLTAKMFSMDCKEEYSDEIETKKYVICIIVYFGFVVLATIWDKMRDKSIKQSTIISKWFVCFSLTSNWKKLTGDKNPDYKRLKCIQGIRTYQTCLVITCHILLAFGQLYFNNPSYVEEIYRSTIARSFVLFFLFITQTYFVISSWLLTNQIMELHKKNGRFSIRDGVVIFLHRVIRFWAPLLVMRYVYSQLYISGANGPGNFETINILERTCRKNYWATFFQLTNLLPIKDVCNVVMWSLSIDTQCYITAVVFFYLALNYQLDVKKGLAYMFLVAYLINVKTFFQFEMPLFPHIDVKKLKRLNFYEETTFSLSYYGFWTNVTSSLIGILFGYFYFLRKDVKVHAFEMLCGPIFVIAPVAAVLSANLETNKMVAILFGPILRPLYSFGIACGIYGMTRNVIQGWSKSICENKYAVLLGPFTFATYICHVFIVFSREGENTSLIQLGMLDMSLALVIDILKSFALGILGALVVEQPGINIKNMILPRIKMKEENCDQQSNSYNNKNK